MNLKEFSKRTLAQKNKNKKKKHAFYKAALYKADGQFVKSFRPIEMIADETLATFITSTSDNHFMALGTDKYNDRLIHVFDAEMCSHLKLIRGVFLSVHLSTEHILIS